jgi:UDP:flavonoid glycosyltransferase YjiC (YdhE family)
MVLVSGTTTGLSGSWFGAFQASGNAIVELGMRGLVTVGTLDPSVLPQNDSLAYRSFVPHSDVLPHASAIVTQCGHGSTIAALRHGVPLVCVPLFADQPDIAARVVHHGAGIRLSTRSSPAEYRDAIREIVNEPRYREAARAVGSKMANEDGISEAANEIEAVGAKG